MQPAAVPGHRLGDLVEVCRDVEEALGPEEVAGPRTARAAHQAQVLMQDGVGWPGRDRHVPAAAFGVESGRDRDRLDQGRLAAAVLAREERHVRVEPQLVELPDRGDREGIGPEVADPVALQDDRADESVLHAASLLFSGESSRARCDRERARSCTRARRGGVTSRALARACRVPVRNSPPARCTSLAAHRLVD